MSTLLISHIPKTAGTSVKVLLRRYQPDTIEIYRDELSSLSLKNILIERIRTTLPAAIIGHFSYGAHRLLGLPPRYATIVRDPVKRVISLYRHLLRENSAALKPGMTLREFVESETTEQTNNHICRVIGGIDIESGLLLNVTWPVELAIYNLHCQYELVGTSDDLDLFVTELGKILRWPPVQASSENSADDGDFIVDEETVEIIKHCNLLDIELFNSIKANLHVASRRGVAYDNIY